MFKKILITLTVLGVFSPANANAGFELAYEGYNAYSMSIGAVTQATPEHFLVVEDRVFFFINEKTKELFERNLERNIERADEFFESLK